MANTHSLIRNTLVFAGLSFASLGIGYGVNTFRSQPLGIEYLTPAQRLSHSSSNQELKNSDAAEPSSESYSIRKEIQVMSLDELVNLQNEDRVVIFDVRPSLFYQLSHIPSSLSLQIKEFDEDYQKHQTLISDSIKAGKEIVLYCAGPHCPDASKVAKKLAEKSYGNLSVFEGGVEVWERAGLDVESSM